MKPRVTIADLYRRYGQETAGLAPVAVYRIEEGSRPASFPHVRRDFYKIELLCQARGVLGYADKHVEVNGCVLIFVNPQIPYSWKRTAGGETGFVCVFTEEFVTPALWQSPLAESPLFTVGPNPIVFPGPEMVSRLTYLFEQLLAEMHSSYTHRYDLMRHYV